MLVLSRRCAESLQIGENIRVTVVAVSGGQVKLAVEAPQDVPIWRSEILEREARLRSSLDLED